MSRGCSACIERPTQLPRAKRMVLSRKPTGTPSDVHQQETANSRPCGQRMEAAGSVLVEG